MIINSVSGGGGVDINGIIKSYTVFASSGVSAGDFVKYVNANDVNCVELSPESCYYTASAVALSDTKVFVAYSKGSSNAGKLYGIVCTINGDEITAGVETQLNTSNYSGVEISVAALSSTSVFIAHSSSSSKYLYGVVCTISGTTITVGTDTKVAYFTGAGSVFSVGKLSSTSVFVAHRLTSSGDAYLYGVVCTISGTTITVGTDTQLSQEAYSGTAMSVAVLSSTKVFIVYLSSSYSYLYGVVCTINGKTITVGTSKQLIVSNSIEYVNIVALNSTKVFIVYNYGYDVLTAVVCTISGTTITAGEFKILSAENYTGEIMSISKISDTKAFIAHALKVNSVYYLYGVVCTVSGTTITVATTERLCGSYTQKPAISCCPVFNSIFIAHSHEDALQGMVKFLASGVLPVTSGAVLGVAKTSGEYNAAIDVYVPSGTT